jgi:hypothetical protein
MNIMIKKKWNGLKIYNLYYKMIYKQLNRNYNKWNYNNNQKVMIVIVIYLKKIHIQVIIIFYNY